MFVREISSHRWEELFINIHHVVQGSVSDVLERVDVLEWYSMVGCVVGILRGEEYMGGNHFQQNNT